ncbi:adenylate/guanylate cyclase domain-containing protein [Salinimicrobium gaetbulicola]|uniref:Adenylate/guanylate cyclase domain-containing protein n=1 Tax=Salinimicrobium gaetbulicola TaxID=999702 RepID=A0ABW3IHU5_9FLAO
MYHFLKFTFLFLFLISGNVFAQDEFEIDSLKRRLASRPSEKNNLELIKNILVKSQEPDSMLKYSRILLNSSLAANNRIFLYDAYHSQGVAWRLKGEYHKSVDYLFKAAEMAEVLDEKVKLAMTNVEIGNTYSENRNSSLAFEYYDRGLKILKEADQTLVIGQTMYNIGDDLILENEIDSALVYTERARKIFRDYNKKKYEAYSLGNLGRIYAKKGNVIRAELYLNEAIKILEKFNDYNAITDFLAVMSDIYLDRNDIGSAIEYGKRSLEAADRYKLKGDLENIHLKLSKIYEKAGDLDEAYNHYKKYVLYKDSIKNIQSIENMANLRTNFEIARKQTEVDLLNEQKKNQKTIVIATLVALLLILLLAFGLYRRNKFIGRTKKIIEREKNRSEILLLNILPQETANELKEKGKVQPKKFDAVSILFTDFKNFTHYAENLSPEELVDSVDFYFSEFDRIMEKYGLEKIKTVGDAYMCAAGVPFPSKDHAIKVVSAACEMIEFVDEAKKLKSEKETRFEMRIGINSGPVIAGVVGTKKFAYDIWGDTVNIASRMESSSEEGKINISENTYELVKDKFECEYRGEVPVKSKGMMKMYFVKWC